MNKFYKAWLFALIVKTLAAIWLPLSNDEAYYWVWGHHPRLSYYDHPPMVGWLFSIGTLFEWIGHGARLPGVWLGHGTLLIWNKILRPFLDENQQRLWLIFVVLSPFMGIGSLIITPDIPLLFFWSLSLYAFTRLIETKSLGWYLTLGASLGLGFCSKYLIVLFVPIAFLYLFASGKWRSIRWTYVPITMLVGLIFCAPVIYWNYQNEWASFAFQLNHGLETRQWKNTWPIEYLGAQVLLLFPTVIWLAVQRREPKEARFLHFFGWFPLLFFLYTSFRARVEANWPIMAHPALLSLAFLNMRSWRPLKVTIGVWIAALFVALSQITFPWLPVDPKQLKTSEFTKFDVFLPELAEDREIFLGSYQMAAALSYKLNRQFYKLNGLNRRDFYDFTPHSRPKSDRFFVGSEITHSLPTWVVEEGYEVASSKQLSDEYHLLEVVKRAENIDN